MIKRQLIFFKNKTVSMKSSTRGCRCSLSAVQLAATAEPLPGGKIFPLKIIYACKYYQT
jgi:hypothetical protein